MTADREFVSTTGTRHRAGWFGWMPHGKYNLFEAACSRDITGDDLVVQQSVKDCKRCYPKGGE